MSTSIPHGTYTRYTGRLGCRCRLCVAAWAAYCRRRRTERTLAADDPRHGRLSTYLNYACRCGPCTAANSTAMRARRAS